MWFLAASHIRLGSKCICSGCGLWTVVYSQIRFKNKTREP